MLSIQNTWFLFAISFAIAMGLAFVKKKISSHFIIHSPTERRFSIFDLQFPGSENRLTNFINHMSEPVKIKLKKLLILQYFFSFFSFTWIAILTYLTAIHINSATGYIILLSLMFAQPVAFVLQLMVNTMLLKKVKHPAKPVKLFKAINHLSAVSYVLGIAAITFVFFSFLFLWLTGLLSRNFIEIFTIILLLLTCLFYGFVIIKLRIENRKMKEEQKDFSASLQLKISKQ